MTGVPAINLEDGSFSIGPEVATLIPKELAVRANVVPLNAGENWIVVAMSNPRDYATIDEVKVLTERNVDVVVASPKGIQSALQRSYFVAGVAT
jgi:type IV pilus assembly protein PilB